MEINNAYWSIKILSGGIGRPTYQQRIQNWNKICKMIDKKKRPNNKLA